MIISPWFILLPEPHPTGEGRRDVAGGVQVWHRGGGRFGSAGRGKGGAGGATRREFREGPPVCLGDILFGWNVFILFFLKLLSIFLFFEGFFVALDFVVNFDGRTLAHQGLIGMWVHL